MAMCSSGSLGIISAPQGGCSSISVAVDGNTTPPKSLCALSITAGKDAPHSMLEFYGYVPDKMVTLVCTYGADDGLGNSYAILCGCVDVNPSLSSGEGFTLNSIPVANTDSGQSPPAFSRVRYFCNSTEVYNLCADIGDSFICYPSHDIYYGDTFEFELEVCTTLTDYSVSTYASTDILSVTAINGSYDFETSFLGIEKPT